MRKYQRSYFGGRTEADLRILAVLSLFYLFGAAVGFLRPGCFQNILPFGNVERSDFPLYTWYYMKVLPLSFLFSFTALGVLLQPVLLAVYGYQTTAVLVFSNWNSLLSFLVRDGLISAVSFTALFYMSSLGLNMAWKRMTQLLGLKGEPFLVRFAARQAAAFLISILIVLSAALVCYFLMPGIVS